MTMKTPLLATLTTLLLTLSACGRIPYRIDIDQGNIIEQQDLSRLRVGMTKRQVQQALGSTLLEDVFHTNRWDYIHRYQQGSSNEIKKSKVSLFFSNGRLARIAKKDFQVIETEAVPYSTSR